LQPSGLTTLGSNPIRDFGFFHVKKLKTASSYGMSVVLLRDLFVPEIKYEVALKVFLHHLSLKIM
jgi:hypothetical protein